MNILWVSGYTANHIHSLRG